MTVLRNAPLLASAAVIVALMFTGCANEADENAGLSFEDRPLAQYLDQIDGARDAETLIAQSNRVEELVSACMAEQGFEYTPVDDSANIRRTASLEDAETRTSTQEWVTSNGWGVVPSKADREAMKTQAENADPNTAYLESLSSAEQSAYKDALWGALASGQPEDDSKALTWDETGCYGKVEHEGGGDSNYRADEDYAGLFEAMDGLWEQTAKQPEVVALEKQWSGCMADEGYPGLESRSDARRVIEEELGALFTGDGEDPSEDAFQALKEKEIDSALADFHCAEQFDYDALQLKVRFALEEQFITDHKSVLDALVAEYAAGH